MKTDNRIPNLSQHLPIRLKHIKKTNIKLGSSVNEKKNLIYKQTQFQNSR